MNPQILRGRSSCAAFRICRNLPVSGISGNAGRCSPMPDLPDHPLGDPEIRQSIRTAWQVKAQFLRVRADCCFAQILRVHVKGAQQ